MKAIVIRQPWATLVSLGVKSIETRPSPPNGPMRPEGVRGLPGCTLERGERIAIVAGADPSQIRRLGVQLCTAGVDRSESIAVHKGLMEHGYALEWASGATSIPLPLGAVVCTVTVDDVLPIRRALSLASIKAGGNYIASSPPEMSVSLIHVYRGETTERRDADAPLGDFTPGRWGWLLGGVQPTPPIPCKGRQGVFLLPDDVAERVS